jgi:hypothetical protein
MSYKKRKFDRKSNLRDANLFIIATEGKETEKQYFEDFAIFYQNPKVNVKVIDKIQENSDPNAVLNALIKFEEEFNFNRQVGDELWIVIDRDRWKDKMLSKVAQICKQKEYSFALSNPCFEFWLLLHLKDLKEYTDIELSNIFENKKTNQETFLERELASLLGSYNKSNLNTAEFLPHIGFAVQQAENLDTKPSERWQNELGTRVYILVKKLINN